MAYEYLAAGVADEITLHAESQRAWTGSGLLPRGLVDVSHIDTGVNSVRADVTSARYPARTLRLPENSSTPTANLKPSAAQTGPEPRTSLPALPRLHSKRPRPLTTQPLWFQLYVNPDRGFTRELVQRAEAAGYEALVVTLDVPVNGPRDRELRAGFSLCRRASRAPIYSRWGPRSPARHTGPEDAISTPIVRAPDVTAKDIEWLKSITKMPVIVKGLLHPDVVEDALRHGADAIYVSNHGGRSLDSVPASIDILPHIVQRVGGAKPVLFDGGVRRGSDIFKALALGADAVGVGRPFLHGLAVAGAAGVARVVEILWAELVATMGLAGATSLEAIDESFLWESPANSGQR